MYCIKSVGATVTLVSLFFSGHASIWLPGSLEAFVFLKFEKIVKKCVYMGNEVYFKCANSQSEIRCIVLYIKKRKL
jgi:hypothetical protein